jgi:hypothetical protein
MALTPERSLEVQGLAEEVMDIVGKVAGRRLAQSLELVHDEYISPLRQALKDCQTLTPSLLTSEQAIERLKEINQHVSAILGAAGTGPATRRWLSPDRPPPP